MTFELPDSTIVDKFIPKSKFYDFSSVNAAIKDEFTTVIGKITYQNRLTSETMHIPATDNIAIINVFAVDLKIRQIPMRALTVIDKSIPAPILFVLRHKGGECVIIQHKIGNKKYYKSDWNSISDLQFTGSTLESIYQRLITSLIATEDTDISEGKSFEEVITTNTQREQLTREISVLENKIRNERQFSKKVELNTELQKKRKQLSQLG